MRVEIADGEFLIDAAVLGELFDVPPGDVPELMRNSAITGKTERGEGDDAGLYRLTFFFRNRRARVLVDGDGRIVWRSVIDLGERAAPSALREGGSASR